MSETKVLDFYPGEKRLVFLVKEHVVVDIEAWGGPEHTVHSPMMNMRPTTPGHYIIHSVGPYRTNTWPLSKIRWGTRLRDTSFDVLFEENPGRWSSVQKKTGLSRAQVIDSYFRLYGEYRVPDRWMFNDFGPLAIRYFRDLNRNRKLDKNEHLMGEMFHTTPDNEAQFARGQSIMMVESHGCIHLKPLDRDKLRNLGAFDRGTPLIIHTYKEHFRR
jgi:hypothetical protein